MPPKCPKNHFLVHDQKFLLASCVDTQNTPFFEFPTLNRWRLGGPKGPNMTENAKNTPKMAQKSHFEVREYLPIWPKSTNKCSPVSSIFDVEWPFQRHLPQSKINQFWWNSVRWSGSPKKWPRLATFRFRFRPFFVIFTKKSYPPPLCGSVCQ